ncbi:hypothetical protein ABK040_010701 [Willaertia magna]
MKTIALFFCLVVLLLTFSLNAEECTHCCCYYCRLTQAAKHYQSCDGSAALGTAPAGAQIKMYASGCQPCAGQSRVLSRVVGDHGWGFFDKSVVQCSPECHVGYNTVYEKQNMKVSCKSAGDYRFSRMATLRQAASGLVCADVPENYHATVLGCNTPTSEWCKVEVHEKSVCNGLSHNYCGGCIGYVLCDSLERL